MKDKVSYHGNVALVGAGMTALSQSSGKSVLELATEAAQSALLAAGLAPRSVDGIVSYSLYGDSVPSESLGAALGIRDLSYVMDFAQGGQSSSFMVMHAAMAVSAGLADTVLVFRAMNGRSGPRIGRVRGTGTGAALRYPTGLVAYPQVQALWFRRYMIETGAGERDLAAVVINARTHGGRNPRALRREAITEAQYFESPYVADPFRFADCTTEIDGACAVVVTSLAKARDLRLAPVVIAGSAWHTHQFDLDMAGILTYESPSLNFAHFMRDRLWAGAGLASADAKVACLYDCFSGVLIQNMEGLGICPVGGAGDYLRQAPDRRAGPVINPSGGLLAEGYLHGMNLIAEAVWQVQGVAGPTQVAHCDVAVTCSGGAHCGSALVLAQDHMRRGP